MGFRVEKYDLHELGRISLPGMVVPSLFWVLPVGNWAHHDLDSLWRHFTEGSGYCRRYGLLLVRDLSGDRKNDSHGADLGDISAHLKDLLPASARRHLPRGFEEDDDRFLLVLSGAYPQPGWGVLVPINHHDPAGLVIERLIASTLSNLGDEVATDLAALGLAAERYHSRDRREHIGGPSPESANLRRQLDVVRAMISAASATIDALCDDDLKNIADKMQSLFSIAASHALGEPLHGKIEELKRHRIVLLNVHKLIATPADVLERDVLPIHVAIARNPACRNDMLRQCDRRVRNAVEALFALERTAAPSEESIHASASRVSSDSISAIQPLLAEMLEAAAADVSELESQLARCMEVENENRLHRQTQIEHAHREVADSLAITAGIQWKLGPGFLVALQDAAMVEGAEAISMAWDAPRMVGWKLMVKGTEITLRDVRAVALELQVPPPEPTPKQEAIFDAPIDGSYFTDYVHFIAISSLETSPREISCRLVASLLRPSQLGSLIQQFGGQCPSEEHRGTLADALLNAMGWRSSGKDHPKPLISYAEMLAPDLPKPGLAPDPVAVRKSLESFCKDVLDVLAHKLGNSGDRIWSAIDCGDPPYVPTSARKSWQEEFACCTAGSGAILIERLGRAMPQIADDCQALADDVGSLGVSLNRLMHHQEAGSGTEEAKVSCKLIRHVVGKAAGILGEIPWHFTPTVRFGDSPKVWSGPAWSHAHVAPRLLRVISLMDDFHGDETLVWNQSGTNPVIADPVFLDRNSRLRR
jgi:hypothetical protein